MGRWAVDRCALITPMWDEDAEPYDRDDLWGDVVDPNGRRAQAAGVCPECGDAFDKVCAWHGECLCVRCRDSHLDREEDAWRRLEAGVMPW